MYGIVAVAFGPDIGVMPIATLHVIIASASNEDITAVVAIQGIITAPANEAVLGSGAC